MAAEGKITVLGPEGDLEIRWEGDPNGRDAYEAQRVYNDQIAQGNAVFVRKGTSWVRDIEHEFNPNVGRYMFLRPYAGG